VIKSAVEYDGYCVKFEEGKTIEGYEVIKTFGEMLGIVVEEEVVENVEEKEVEIEIEEEKKLMPQQLRKKYFLKRMKNFE
jgi:MORN variant repeat protein